jgi:hypothetical protein
VLEQKEAKQQQPKSSLMQIRTLEQKETCEPADIGSSQAETDTGAVSVYHDVHHTLVLGLYQSRPRRQYVVEVYWISISRTFYYIYDNETRKDSQVRLR